MSVRLKARSATPGAVRFAAGVMDALLLAANVQKDIDRGDGTLGTYDPMAAAVFPDPAYVHLDAGNYGPTGSEYTPELSLLENWTEIASPAAATDCIPVRIAAAVAQEINLAAAGGTLSKSFTAVFSFGSEITKLEDINDGGLVVDVLPAQAQEWGHVAGGKYRHAVVVKVGIRRRIASTDRTEAGAVDSTDVTGYVNLLYEIISLFAAGRNLTAVADAVWNSGVRPTIQLYDEQQLKQGLYVGWTHLPFLYHEPAGE